jgi:Zn-finger nucleic acid-binding protein
MRCPKCSGALLTVDAGAVEIDCCSSCNGIWLDFGELRRIDPAAAPPIQASTTPTAAAAGACPRCPEISLWSHPVAPDLPAVVADCRLCGGVWLAASELDRVKRYAEARAIAPPGRPGARAEGTRRPASRLVEHRRPRLGRSHLGGGHPVPPLSTRRAPGHRSAQPLADAVRQLVVCAPGPRSQDDAEAVGIGKREAVLGRPVVNSSWAPGPGSPRKTPS